MDGLVWGHGGRGKGLVMMERMEGKERESS